MSRKVTVIGAGVSGQGLAMLAHNLGYEVFVSEQKKIPDEVKASFTKNQIAYEEGHSEKVFEGTSEILISSGIPPKSEILHEASKRNVKLTGELDFSIPHIRTQNLICVTGSNGKSTVTSLIGHILNCAGMKAGAGGNLGTASSAFTSEDFDSVVLELSSFQLERATQDMHSKIAIVTNLAPDHIDWHGSYENYVAAKAKILSLRDYDGWGIIQDRDADMLSPSGRIITLSNSRTPEHKFAGHIFMDTDKAVLTLGEKTSCLFRYSDTSLIGMHNFENVAMSLCTVKLLGLDSDSFGVKYLLEGFKPLPHRCEDAGTLNGVQYIDDSKGTNVAASVTAMKSIHGRKIIILGGQGKGEDYMPLAEAVKSECDEAVLLGEEAGKICDALKRSGYPHEKIHMSENMRDAVNISESLAKPGMYVLLSPACTSWDMYKSYKARGEDFCNIVREKIDAQWKS